MAASGKLLYGALLAASLSGCVSVASIEDLPATAQNVPFDELAARGERKDGAWNAQTDFDYYFEVVETDESRVHEALKTALGLLGYTLMQDSAQERTVIGSRGMSMAEWGSVSGAYYRKKGSIFQVYIKSSLTQDVTGSWEENRAKSIANRLCSELLKCNGHP